MGSFKGNNEEQIKQVIESLDKEWKIKFEIKQQVQIFMGLVEVNLTLIK